MVVSSEVCNTGCSLREAFRPKQNGLTAVRLSLATLVLVGHSFELSGNSDPMFTRFGVTLGEVAVNAFFGISGYLITSSWMRVPVFVSFLKKRARRILPGLWCCLLVTGFVLLPAVEYIHDGANTISFRDSAYYVIGNSCVKLNCVRLGGVFAGLPANGIVNNSLWSLLPEVLCYLLIPAIYGISRGLNAARSIIPYWIAWGAMAVIAGMGPKCVALTIFLSEGRAWLIWRYATQGLFFLSGAILFLCAQRVRCNWTYLSIVVALFIFGIATGQYRIVAPICLPYSILAFSALSPFLGIVDKCGDYSYGLYIYHYPVIQTALWLRVLNDSSPLAVCTTCLLVTMPIAIASWHFIEQPFVRGAGVVRAGGVAQ